MRGMVLQLSSFVSISIGLAALVTGAGCSRPTSTSPAMTRIDMVRQVFPSAIDIVEMSVDGESERSARSGRRTVREIKGPSHLLGYLVESEVAGRSGPFGIAVLLDEKCVIKRAIVVSYPWMHGRAVTRHSFTGQFEGKGPESAIEMGKDIDAATGATISCEAMAQGVREAIALLAK